MRGREFVMKDSYSFDLDDDGLRRVYQAHRRAYQNMFDRMAIRYVIVSAMSGAMGGWRIRGIPGRKRSRGGHFRSLRPIGLRHERRGGDHSGAGRNLDRRASDATVHETGDTPTIVTLVDWANSAGLGRTVTAADTLKNVMLKIRRPGGEWNCSLSDCPVTVRSTTSASSRFEPGRVRLPRLDDADFARNTFLCKGYIGPEALRANGVRYLLDPRIVDGTSWITGADEPGRHVVGLVAGRDFSGDGTIEAAEVRDGDLSPDGAGPLVSARGIEIGHLPARPQVHRHVLGRCSGRRRQAGSPDHGFLRWVSPGWSPSSPNSITTVSGCGGHRRFRRSTSTWSWRIRMPGA